MLGNKRDVSLDAGKVLAGIRNTVRRADECFDRFYLYGEEDEFDKANFEWYTEKAFLELLAFSDSLGLMRLLSDISKSYEEAKKTGLYESKMGPGEPYSIWLSKLRMYISVLETVVGVEKGHEITKDVEAILRSSNYSITDLSLFTAPPKDEKEVHMRIEGILKCVFPDLLSKPRLSKPIKSFEPDTGLPSVTTLIEYKFISSKNQVSQIADEILADTRGYESREWDNFVYVIYETIRIRPEHEWNSLLRRCNIPRSTSIIVLSGEDPHVRKKRSPLRRRAS